MYINDLAINIILQTLALKQQDFGLPLILGSRSEGSLIGTYTEFSELTELVSAGFAVTDPEYLMAAKMVAQSPRPETIAVHVRNSSAAIAAALTALIETHNNWYGLLITERDKTSVNAAGDWALSNKKLFFGCTADLTAFADRNNIRETYCIHDGAADYPEAAVVGLCLPQDIGSITWKWKQPTGVVASNFTLTELNAIRAGNCWTLSKRSGVVYTDEGITTGGQYIDVIQSRDYVEAKISEELFALQLKSSKISFDNPGFALIEASLRSSLKMCGNRGIIARATTDDERKQSDDGVYMYTVTVPLRSEIAANDRAARKIPGIKFQFTIAGAVHNVTVIGYIGA